MPNRSTHNFFSKFLHPEYDYDKIDKTNERIDAPSQITPGMAHRKFYHSFDIADPGSMEIHGGDVEKYLINVEHIILDNDPELAKMIKIMEIIDGNKRGDRRGVIRPKNR